MRYIENDCAIIYKSHMANYYGSNMANDFPIFYKDLLYYSSETLYQSLRFTKSNHYQDIVTYININNAFVSKQRAYEFIAETRSDWDDVKVDIMEMVLRIKTEQHKSRITDWLYQTGTRDIVEKSYKDGFWGAIPKGQYLEGYNCLGTLWMIIREELQNKSI